MYDMNVLHVPDMCAFLGLGRNTVLRLCKEKVHGFPVVKVGQRYQADKELLATWKKDWYSGKFDIN